MATFKDYLRYYWYFESSKVTTFINGIFYYLRQLPIVGKRINVAIFKNYEIKQILFVMGMVISVLYKLVLKTLWTAFPIFLGAFMPGDSSNENMQVGIILWLFFIPLGWRFYEGVGQVLDKKELNFVNAFQLSRPTFLRSTMGIATLYDGLAYLPILLLIGFIAKQPLLLPLVLFFLYLTFSFLFFYLGRLLIGLNKVVRTLLGSLYLFFLCGLLAVILWQGLAEIIVPWVINPVVLVISILALVGVVNLLFSYPKETEYINIVIEKSVVSIQKVADVFKESNNYLGEGIRMQKDMVVETDQFLELEGGQYLNALLFSRYRKTLYKQLGQRLIGIVGVGGIIAILIGIFGVGEFQEKDIIGFLPVLFFLMYVITFGKKVVQLAFVNCDSPMLYYPFYRESKTILAGFYYRFWQTFKYNSILAGAIFAMMVVIGFAMSGLLSFSFFAVLALLLISLAFLFSFHELFVYYLLQPFTSDLEVVNPLYKFISGLLYWISYINLQIRSTGVAYVIIVSVISLIYVVLGLVIVSRFAPKTFRYKG